METTDLDRLLSYASNRQEWSPRDFLLFCRDGVRVVQENPEDRQRVAYAIVEEGRRFGDFDTEDDDPIRGRIKDLAADLELPDRHVDTSDGLSVQDKWELLGRLVEKGLTTK